MTIFTNTLILAILSASLVSQAKAKERYASCLSTPEIKNNPELVKKLKRAGKKMNNFLKVVDQTYRKVEELKKLREQECNGKKIDRRYYDNEAQKLMQSGDQFEGAYSDINYTYYDCKTCDNGLGKCCKNSARSISNPQCIEKLRIDKKAAYQYEHKLFYSDVGGLVRLPCNMFKVLMLKKKPTKTNLQKDEEKPTKGIGI